MSIVKNMTDVALLRLLGERIAQVRLNRNLSQQQVADQAGIGLRTVQRLEQGAAATQLSGFIRICRVLGLSDGFDALVPPVAPSPVLQLKQRGRIRKRASSARNTDAVASSSQPWHWGEKAP